MRRFVLAPLAKQDLKDIRDYIAKDSSTAARRVLKELRAKMAFLAEAKLLDAFASGPTDAQSARDAIAEIRRLRVANHFGPGLSVLDLIDEGRR